MLFLRDKLETSIMKSLRIKLSEAKDELLGKSKWWGAADLPDGWDYPEIPYEDGDNDPMTLVCQIRCADLAAIDTENLLPHEGMLYFFAAIDEYVHALDEDGYYVECECHNGMGEWSPEAYRVLYSPTEDDLVIHNTVNADGSPAYLHAEEITFEAVDDVKCPDFKLLGKPYYDEIEELYPDYLNLLQIEENEDWGLVLYDCGMICFLILPEDLKARRFDRVKVYFHSF